MTRSYCCEEVVMSKTVLVLDDDSDIVDLLKDLLETMDEIKSVVTSVSFSDALNKLNNQSFDHIISDYNLSGQENGIDFIKEVRSIDKMNNHKTRIFLISASLDKQILSQALYLNVKDIIVKPFTLDKLRSVFTKENVKAL